MNTNHSPAPWRIDQSKSNGNWFIHTASRKVPIAGVLRFDEDESQDVGVANAKRIVSCVNACEGFANPEHDINQAMKNGQIAQELLDCVEALIAYAEDVLNDKEQLACFKPGVVQAHVSAARAAIAKAKATSA